MDGRQDGLAGDVGEGDDGGEERAFALCVDRKIDCVLSFGYCGGERGEIKMTFRRERDSLGEKEIPAEALWGIHTARAIENFPVSGRRVAAELIHAFGEVKLAAARTNRRLNYLSVEKAEAIEKASAELAAGKLDEFIRVDALQGGAGTSTNLNVCEVIANRALQIAGRGPGQYDFIDPVEHVNLHQSTNDTFPTALKVAAYKLLKLLEAAVTGLQETCQAKEREFADVIKIGRTELMDAVPMTLGRTFGAWADAYSRDRWRIYKCTERIRVVNLGGTAIGTGMGADRDYIFKVTDELRAITGLPLARAENLFEATQNADVYVEVAGILQAHAANLMKMAGDLRLLASGPDTGLAEINLPAMQTGSSIMPGKINPVMTEMLSQVGMEVFSDVAAIAMAAGAGQLELNAFLPLIADKLLGMLRNLVAANRLMAEKCIYGITANVDRCRELAHRSSALATVLLPKVGYHKATEIAEYMRSHHCDIFEAAKIVAEIDRDEIMKLISSEAVNALGFAGKKQEG
jgi:aspartate ammonia-lyase